MTKVLLVEDEQYIAQGLSMLIDWESCGYEIAGTAYNGQEAVEFLQDTPVDLILSDIKMPVMDGIEATKVIREIEKRENKYTPIIAFTANTLNNDYHTCKSNGMDHLLEKPFSVSKFTQILEELDN